MRIPAKRAMLLKVGGHSGAPPSVEPLTHTQTSYASTRELIWQWATVVRYNHLFAQSIVTHCPGVGSVFLPWRKGLMQPVKLGFFSLHRQQLLVPIHKAAVAIA